LKKSLSPMLQFALARVKDLCFEVSESEAQGDLLFAHLCTQTDAVGALSLNPHPVLHHRMPQSRHSGVQDPAERPGPTQRRVIRFIPAAAPFGVAVFLCPRLPTP